MAGPIVNKDSYNALCASLNHNRRIVHTFNANNHQLYFDNFLTYVFKRPMLDLWKFDDFMHELYGDYEERGLNLHDLLVEKQGADFAAWIEGFL